tara:strand:- start:146 stop:355 length:210 start_codon:yes stop_codon:yes gene_type:complete
LANVVGFSGVFYFTAVAVDPASSTGTTGPTNFYNSATPNAVVGPNASGGAKCVDSSLGKVKDLASPATT